MNISPLNLSRIPAYICHASLYIADKRKSVVNRTRAASTAAFHHLKDIQLAHIFSAAKSSILGSLLIGGTCLQTCQLARVYQISPFVFLKSGVISVSLAVVLTVFSRKLFAMCSKRFPNRQALLSAVPYVLSVTCSTMASAALLIRMGLASSYSDAFGKVIVSNVLAATMGLGMTYFACALIQLFAKDNNLPLINREEFLTSLADMRYMFHTK